MRPTPFLLSTAFALGFLFPAAPSPALAQQSPIPENFIDKMEREFKNRDKNKDGYLDDEELSRELRDLSAGTWDKNGDGKISLYEYTRGVGEFVRGRAEKALKKWGPMKGGTGPEFENWAASQFKERDRDKDGVLNRDEMGGQIRNDLSRWDTNKDDKIDPKEFRAFMAERVEKELAVWAKPLQELERWLARVVIQSDDDLNPPVVVYHSGNLPEGLPAWFKALDLNKDGQVSLLEWLKGNKSAATFRAPDRNDDGLLTAEEVLRFVQLERTDPGALVQELERRGIRWDPKSMSLADKVTDPKAMTKAKSPP